MPQIERLSALEILDSRGRPTLQVNCELSSGAAASAQVPSGASTGKSEARELRDGDPTRHRGLGCRQAVAKVNGPIAAAICGPTFDTQATLDRALIDLDGTINKANLGANAILGVSLVFARACSMERGVPLYQQMAEQIGHVPQKLPRLTINLFSGGKHAGGQIAVQDLLIAPRQVSTIGEGLARACAVYQAAAELVQEKYGMRLLRADEGGLAPPFTSIEQMLDDALTAIDRAGFEAGRDVELAMDVAASHFYRDGRYQIDNQSLTGKQMIEQVVRWASDYPIISVEDALAEDDWQHWPELRARLAGRTLTLGDDLLCTNPERIRRAIDCGACDALLLKVNQVGTLTEAAEALRLARQANWHVTVSARSGETEDTWLADLAVGWGGDQIKIGSITQSERLAKYNRLLAIEQETNWPSG